MCSLQFSISFSFCLILLSFQVTSCPVSPWGLYPVLTCSTCVSSSSLSWCSYCSLLSVSVHLCFMKHSNRSPANRSLIKTTFSFEKLCLSHVWGLSGVGGRSRVWDQHRDRLSSDAAGVGLLLTACLASLSCSHPECPRLTELTAFPRPGGEGQESAGDGWAKAVQRERGGTDGSG